MSDELVDTLWTRQPYLHSPFDDLKSFYYTAQWAVAFNDGAKEGKFNGAKIEYFRQMIAGDDRSRATTMVRDEIIPDIEGKEYGPFFAHSLSLLGPWHEKLATLGRDWKRVAGRDAVPGNEEEKRLGLDFLIYGYRGVGEYFELLHEHRVVLQEEV